MKKLYISALLSVFASLQAQEMDLNLPPPQLEEVFSVPGIATLQNGQWVGSENLYNISSDIGLVMEVIQPQGQQIPFQESIVKEKVAAILQQAWINPRLTLLANQSPLPFLHMLIMLHPIEKGYVAYCATRLFEAVSITRAHFRSEFTWQAITWEKQELLIFSKEHMQEQLDKTFQNMASAFRDRVKSYDVRPTAPTRPTIEPITPSSKGPIRPVEKPSKTGSFINK